ncbi:unnamed protein product [Mytilus edulis]|uniref:Erythroid differentiation-related factor 1 n=1 Tax=Mytilus edulis TaxID=6550 RepID=A0A8S3PU78_MYTED|nr:unnamed protein product [Mytilus edulis]
MQNTEKIKTKGKELVKRNKDDNQEVKSMVVVKHSTVPVSTAFSILQPSTNLNVPPSNWLRNSSRMEKNIFDFTWDKKEHSQFSSIEMANNDLDLTGEVDVISNSNNIKKILKMPVSKGHISMMVHRIGKTLLIDEFDVHKHLLRQQQDDWKWLREFYYQSVAKEMQIKCVPKKNKSRDTLQNRNMLSKFLYRSIADTNEAVDEFSQTVEDISNNHDDNLVRTEQLEAPGFSREVLWTFEDIRMLIGTDLPIFGDQNCPCISLRLRDMQTPINVLTGLDYWLDNLMSSVPEVAMCYHLNGIVQKYELIKTEDIPNLKNSEFDPAMMADVARNILAFLKSNATKEGHTYWLYKGIDDEVVKLYDLTALCSDSVNDSPFTVPLGMLLYRVARNLWQQDVKKKRSTIRTLLENCLILLDEDKHAQVFTSACYLLSDLYVPESAVNDDWDDGGSENGDTDDSEHSEQEEECRDNTTTTIDVKALCVKSQSYCKAREFIHTKCMTENVHERCNITLQFIAKGLKSVDKDFTIQTRKQHHIVEEQRRCYSNEAIPLHYEPLKKSAPPFDDKHTPLHDMEHLQVSETTASRTWHRLSKVLLLQKATITFYSIAKSSFVAHNLSCSFKYIKLALQCFAGIRILLPKKAHGDAGILVQILSLAGDIHLMYIHRGVDTETIVPEYSDEEITIMDSVNRELETFEYEWVCSLHDEMKGRLLLCCQCYSVAIETAQSITTDSKCEPVLSLTKRHGNILNELGVWYMNQAQCLLQKADGIFPKGEFESLCEESCACLKKGMSKFQAVGDKANKALLMSNKGRLYRVKAQEQSQKSRTAGKEFSTEERNSCKLAISCYQKALEILKHRESFQEIWDSICWELSTTFFNMAILLQDYAPLSSTSQEEVEKEVAVLMNKSLRYCNTQTTSAKQPMYTYRAGTINHRLASLYHNGLRQQENEQKQKYLKQLAESHYSKAIRYFQSVDSTLELFRVQLEQVALQEYILSSQSNNRSKQRTLTLALSYILSCHDIVQKILKQSQEPDFDEKSKQEAVNLSDILQSRLQFVLLQIMKCQTCNKKRIGKTDMDKIKTLYASSLKKGSGATTGLEKLPVILCILDDVRVFYEESLVHEIQPG